MSSESPFDRFHRKRLESVLEMRRIRDETDTILSRLEQHGPVAVPDLARLEGLRAQRASAFDAYQSAEDELISALLATLKRAREDAD